MYHTELSVKKQTNMCQIGENLEETVKESLNYEHQTVSIQRKLFDKLKSKCMVHRIPMKLNNHYIQSIKIAIYHSSKGETDGVHNDSYYVWVKPIVRHGRLYLSFKKPFKKLIDASHVECFGEDIHLID